MVFVSKQVFSSIQAFCSVYSLAEATSSVTWVFCQAGSLPGRRFSVIFLKVSCYSSSFPDTKILILKLFVEA